MKTKHAEWMEGLSKSAIELWNEQDFFKVQEIVPQGVFEELGERSIALFSPSPIVAIIETRILFDSPMTINDWLWGGRHDDRGWRPPEHECVEYSQHRFANAFDYDVKGLTAEEARQKLIEWKNEGKLPYLAGIEKDVNWVHNDYRITDDLDENGLFLF